MSQKRFRLNEIRCIRNKFGVVLLFAKHLIRGMSCSQLGEVKKDSAKGDCPGSPHFYKRDVYCYLRSVNKILVKEQSLGVGFLFIFLQQHNVKLDTTVIWSQPWRVSSISYLGCSVVTLENIVRRIEAYGETNVEQNTTNIGLRGTKTQSRR